MPKIDIAVLPCFYEALQQTITKEQLPVFAFIKNTIVRANGSMLYQVRLDYNNCVNIDKLIELAQKRALEGYDKFELEAN